MFYDYMSVKLIENCEKFYLNKFKEFEVFFIRLELRDTNLLILEIEESIEKI